MNTSTEEMFYDTCDENQNILVLGLHQSRTNEILNFIEKCLCELENSKVMHIMKNIVKYLNSILHMFDSIKLSTNIFAEEYNNHLLLDAINKKLNEVALRLSFLNHSNLRFSSKVYENFPQVSFQSTLVYSFATYNKIISKLNKIIFIIWDKINKVTEKTISTNEIFIDDIQKKNLALPFLDTILLGLVPYAYLTFNTNSKNYWAFINDNIHKKVDSCSLHQMKLASILFNQKQKRIKNINKNKNVKEFKND